MKGKAIWCKLAGLLLAVMLCLSLKTQVASAASTPLTFTAETNGSSITFSWSQGVDVQYSVDNGKTWNAYNEGCKISLNAGNTVCFKGYNTHTSAEEHFTMTGSIRASGDVTSLIDRNGGDVDLTYYMNCFDSMFYNCTSLKTAPSLPSTTLGSQCYTGMFCGCTNLTEAPVLPATTLAVRCYESMFAGCTGLTIAPELPATTVELFCYHNMFSDCTGLTAAPALPATTMANSCYESMFSGCTGLITAPELPARTLASSCYYGMFEGCTGLTTAPLLYAKTLELCCYMNMFKDCTNLAIYKESSSEHNQLYRIPVAGKITLEASHALDDMFTNTGGDNIGTPATNTSYYMKAANSYTVSFLKKSGIKYSMIYEEQTVTEGEKAVKPADPTQDGYVFEGWYTDTNFQNKFDFNTPITADLDLYPHFVKASAVNVSDIFTDVSDSAWFHDAVQYVYENGLMTGKSATVFAPTGVLSRGQFATILWRMSGSPAAAYSAKFPDVKDGQFYTTAVLWANSVGVITGYQDGTFGPSNPITREQMALMMYRYAKVCGYDRSTTASFDGFTDANKVSGFAKEAMQWAVGMKIITGKQNGTALEPQGKATRAECATIIMRFMKAYK